MLPIFRQLEHFKDNEDWIGSSKNVHGAFKDVTTIPAGCGRPVAGCVPGSALVQRFRGSADSSVSWTGWQTQNRDQSLTWTHTPMVEIMFTSQTEANSETLNTSF